MARSSSMVSTMDNADEGERDDDEGGSDLTEEDEDVSV